MSMSSREGLHYDTPLLFTPGPLGVSQETKEAMLFDLGSRDPQFMNVVKNIRTGVLESGGVPTDSWSAVPMQGSGTFGVESSIQTTVPRGGKLLVLINGAYGRRAVDMAKAMSVDCVSHEFSEDEVVNPEKVSQLLKENSGVTNVMVVHCETSSGLLNPVADIGKVVKEHDPSIRFMIDSMSAFGGIETDVEQIQADVLVTSANKCFEGVPGFSWVLIRNALLDQCKGNSRSLSLDVYQQEMGLRANGQFRFTPPTHALLAFRRALIELENEGGITGRSNRYRKNAEVVWKEFSDMGFKRLLPAEISSHFITTYLFPNHPNFSFEKFYSSLSEKGCNIYPGKVTQTPCFRIGHIGQLFPKDMEKLVEATKDTLKEMDISIPVPPPLEEHQK
eukprot:CAMPEP_0201520754 /NCGR_PEP_ID=MMETSP0161_2-20130828/12476_1 /ASSEMBLY_ACC=CAM_ASM_000251 /TAXON_ID=180227 /ORGANISM="Neoparamoeba aestuarina, Strain SoJaBio B1-5/56/2" /LENGTH=390 /DNA_ID=CAMNT_0047919233 /DNA_START=116 /DNA_END=1288 /DNA_ORIENTATION=-